MPRKVQNDFEGHCGRFGIEFPESERDVSMEVIESFALQGLLCPPFSYEVFLGGGKQTRTAAEKDKAARWAEKVWAARVHECRNLFIQAYHLARGYRVMTTTTVRDAAELVRLTRQQMWEERRDDDYSPYGSTEHVLALERQLELA